LRDVFGILWGEWDGDWDSPVHAGPLRETPPLDFWRRFLSSDPAVAEPGVGGGSDDPGDPAGAPPLPWASLLVGSEGLSWSGLDGLTMCGTVGTANWPSDAAGVNRDAPASEGLICGWLGCLAGAGGSICGGTGADEGAALGGPA
jgi:hypothetical protein